MLTLVLGGIATAAVILVAGMLLGVYLERGHTGDLRSELESAVNTAQGLSGQVANLRAQLETARHAHLVECRPRNVHHALYQPPPPAPGEALTVPIYGLAGQQRAGRHHRKDGA